MKMGGWYLLVLLPYLFVSGRSDCQGQCVACGLILQQQLLQQTFNTMVCLLECEGHLSSSLTWDVCRRAVTPSFKQLFKRDGEEVELTSDGEEAELTSDGEEAEQASDGEEAELTSDREDAEQLSDGEEAQLLGSSEEGPGLGLDEDRKPRYDGDEESEEEEGTAAGVALSKRFGGFQRGRHGYRKLIGTPVRPLQKRYGDKKMLAASIRPRPLPARLRPLQKRYGGFIGVRRKWKSQKRVNQLLRQYLRVTNGNGNRLWRPVHL